MAPERKTRKQQRAEAAAKLPNHVDPDKLKHDIDDIIHAIEEAIEVV